MRAKFGLNVTLILAVLLAGMAAQVSEAEACRGCGIFGRGCRNSYYPSYSYYQPSYYQPCQQTPTSFIFNNTYPVPYLAPSGTTGYGAPVAGAQANYSQGYSMAALPYSVDVAGALDRQSRLAQVAFEGGTNALAELNASIQNATALNDAADRRSKNLAITQMALQANNMPVPAGGALASGAYGAGMAAAAPSRMNFTATFQNGQWSLSGQPSEPVGLPAGPPVGPPQQFGVGYNVCATCHDGAGTHNEPKTLVYNGSRAISPEEYNRALDAILLEKMPPPSTGVRLAPQDKSAVLKELLKLVGAEPAVQPMAQPQQ